MGDRALLERIDFEKGTIMLEGKEYPLRDTFFPTIDPSDPYRLSPEEEDLMQRLQHSFLISEHLQTHVRKMLRHGSMYGIYNENLLFHASVPLDEHGELLAVDIDGTPLKGRELLDAVDMTAFALTVADSIRRKTP